jgi:hypothetical protein
MKIAVGTAHVTVVNIPEKGELWPTYEKVNVPTTGDVQQVPLSGNQPRRIIGRKCCTETGSKLFLVEK